MQFDENVGFDVFRESQKKCQNTVRIAWRRNHQYLTFINNRGDNYYCCLDIFMESVDILESERDALLARNAKLIEMLDLIYDFYKSVAPNGKNNSLLQRAKVLIAAENNLTKG